MSYPDLLELLGPASEHPSHVQLASVSLNTTTSFNEIWQRAGYAGRQFRRFQGPSPVAGILSPSQDMIACAVGCLRFGIDFISLPLPGRGQSPADFIAQIREVMRLANADKLVMESAYLALVGAMAPDLRTTCVAAETIVAEGRASPVPERDHAPGRLIQFSSGTTGAPKGVVLSTRNIGASVAATIEALQIRPGDCSCQWVPLSHDMGLIGGLFTAWAGAQARFLKSSHGRYVCISPEKFLARPRLWLEACAESGATITAAPSFAYHLVARHLRGTDPLNLAQLRVALIGAEPILPRTLREFAAAARPHGFDERALCPAYGLAEATLAVSFVPPGACWNAVTLQGDDGPREFVGCGRPLSCVEVQAPADVPGPIIIRGPAVSGEHVPSRSTRDDGWLDTNDLGVLLDGELIVTGRTDDMLCIAGRNMYAWELEEQASSIHGVRPGNCLIVPDDNGRYVFLYEGGDHDVQDVSELLPTLRGRLAAYAGVGPSAIGCLPRGSLPKTPSGKLQRRKVRAQLSLFMDRCTVQRSF